MSYAHLEEDLPPAYPAEPRVLYQPGVQVKQPDPAAQTVGVTATVPPAQQAQAETPAATAEPPKPGAVPAQLAPPASQSQPGVQPARPQPQAVVVQQVRTAPVVYDSNISRFASVPCLHIGAAIAVLFLNIVAPGSGTIKGGFFMLCCGHPYSNAQDPIDVLCRCLLIGFCQSLLASVFFIGWFWAIYTGVTFISASSYYGHPFESRDTVTTTVVHTA